MMYKRYEIVGINTKSKLYKEINFENINNIDMIHGNFDTKLLIFKDMKDEIYKEKIENYNFEKIGKKDFLILCEIDYNNNLTDIITGKKLRNIKTFEIEHDDKYSYLFDEIESISQEDVLKILKSLSKNDIKRYYKQMDSLLKEANKARKVVLNRKKEKYLKQKKIERYINSFRKKRI